MSNFFLHCMWLLGLVLSSLAHAGTEPCGSNLNAELSDEQKETQSEEQKNLSTQSADSLRHYWLFPLVVKAKTPAPGEGLIELSGDPVEKAIEDLGLQVLRRGAAMTGDLIAGTYKRSDIEILIDGERHPAACPNRMDNASTRLSSAEMESMEVLRSCCAPAASLGGQLEYHRKQAVQSLTIDTQLQTSLLAASDQALHFGIALAGWRAAASYSMGAGFANGAGKEFHELYPYGEKADYSAHDVSLLFNRGELALGASRSVNHDLPFPYLMMDERDTEHLAAHLAWKGHRLYANSTEHLMDNALRLSPAGEPLGAPTMVSDARNFIVGLSGEAYHISFYRWDLDNHFLTAGGRIDNHMIPDLRQLRADFHHVFSLPKKFSLSVKAGFVHDEVGDEERVKTFHSQVSTDPSVSRQFWNHGLALQHAFQIAEVDGALMLESASEDPELESL
jgi:hypothetical protein